MALYDRAEVFIGGRPVLAGRFVEYDSRDRAWMVEIHGQPTAVSATVSGPVDPGFLAALFGQVDREAWEARVCAGIDSARREPVTAAELRARMGLREGWVR